jgi:hypothetical protein
LRVQGDCQREIGRIAIDDRGRRLTAMGRQKALVAFAEQNDLAYDYESRPRSPSGNDCYRRSSTRLWRYASLAE